MEPPNFVRPRVVWTIVALDMAEDVLNFEIFGRKGVSLNLKDL